MATPRDTAGAWLQRLPGLRGARGSRGVTVLALTLPGLSALLGACSSAGPPARPGSAGTQRPASGAAVRTTCAQVSAVLSDGPDPDADPVGYAEAQILPLGQIRTSDPRLRAAIGKLASACRAFFDSNGNPAAAKLAVAAASKRVNSFCSGAAS